jgi:DNA-binding MarR family transcriptional regulator
MTHTPATDIETYTLAERFLGVFLRLTQLTEDETPDDVVAQLNVNQLRALNLIYREPGISQKALAERLEITPASVSVSIGKMLDAELVEKHHDDADGRFTRLYLGSRGQELVRKVESAQTRTIAELLGGLPPEEQRNVVETLERALLVREQNLQSELVVEK